jgi:hypothetical protein
MLHWPRHQQKAQQKDYSPVRKGAFVSISAGAILHEAITQARAPVAGFLTTTTSSACSIASWGTGLHGGTHAHTHTACRRAVGGHDLA